ncbi:MAG: LytTR family DNA-binding domain-containing protein [Eubacterium sp.]|nr:LytTR family DNA-binding domain-containing protein [Eubacterium sp.]
MRVVICDDEMEDATRTRDLLEGYKGISDIKIYTPDELIFDIEEDFFEGDIVILDIEYHKEINGIDLGHMLNKKYPVCQIIYLTKLTDFASDVYETEHVYFVTKQNQEKTLFRAVRKAIEMYQNDLDYKHIEIYTQKRKRIIQQRGIIYLERFNRKTYIYIGDEKLETYQSLTGFIKELSNEFVRCHGSYIINVRYVDSIEKGKVTLNGGIELPIGRTYQDNVMKVYMRFLSKRM